jgi:hypothetical protein
VGIEPSRSAYETPKLTRAAYNRNFVVMIGYDPTLSNVSDSRFPD